MSNLAAYGSRPLPRVGVAIGCSGLRTWNWLPSRETAGGSSIGRYLALVLTLASLALLGYAAYYERTYRQFARALDNEAAALRKVRWERPVLRGRAGEGNAAEELYAALADWRALPSTDRERLAREVYFRQPLSAASKALLEQRAPTLEAVRAATQQAWTQTDLALELGGSMRVPEYRNVAEAALCLLAQAQQAPAEACLAIAADVIRIGQDLVPGAPLEAASASTHLIAMAARTSAFCARGANLATLRRAGHELRVLVTHPPPTGLGVELEEVAAAMDLRRAAALTNKASPWQVARALMLRPQLLAAWRVYENPARFRQTGPERYPDAMEDWRREQDLRLESNLASVADGADHVLSRIHDDMRGQALLRMVELGVAALAERAYRGTLPSQPPGLRDPALCDPFRGQPLGYRIASNGSELTLWSVGEDFHDDGGSDDWAGPAPKDVTLHFALSRADVNSSARQRL